MNQLSQEMMHRVWDEVLHHVNVSIITKEFISIIYEETNFMTYLIWGFHGGEDSDTGLVDCDDM
jgi:hypothetical protein